MVDQYWLGVVRNRLTDHFFQATFSTEPAQALFGKNVVLAIGGSRGLMWLCFSCEDLIDVSDPPIEELNTNQPDESHNQKKRPPYF